MEIKTNTTPNLNIKAELASVSVSGCDTYTRKQVDKKIDDAKLALYRTMETGYVSQDTYIDNLGSMSNRVNNVEIRTRNVEERATNIEKRVNVDIPNDIDTLRSSMIKMNDKTNSAFDTSVIAIDKATSAQALAVSANATATEAQTGVATLMPLMERTSTLEKQVNENINNEINVLTQRVGALDQDGGRVANVETTIGKVAENVTYLTSKVNSAIAGDWQLLYPEVTTTKELNMISVGDGTKTFSLNDYRDLKIVLYVPKNTSAITNGIYQLCLSASPTAMSGDGMLANPQSTSNTAVLNKSYAGHYVFNIVDRLRTRNENGIIVNCTYDQYGSVAYPCAVTGFCDHGFNPNAKKKYINIKLTANTYSAFPIGTRVAAYVREL